MHYLGLKHARRTQTRSKGYCGKNTDLICNTVVKISEIRWARIIIKGPKKRVF